MTPSDELMALIFQTFGANYRVKTEQALAAGHRNIARLIQLFRFPTKLQVKNR